MHQTTDIMGLIMGEVGLKKKKLRTEEIKSKDNMTDNCIITAKDAIRQYNVDIGIVLSQRPFFIHVSEM